MASKSNVTVSVVVPNWNGIDSLKDCLDSLLSQTLKPYIIVVENGSTDGSGDYLENNYPDIDIIYNSHNLGFAGGVNTGIRRSIKLGHTYVALLNNDAVADKNWLKNLVKAAETDNRAGIITCKFLTMDQKHIDSTGDLYTVWGLPYPRGRGEPVSNKYDKQTEIFAASGGASLYRTEMLQEIGLFDEDFFAYYEDVDISFRAQLAGWRVIYEPTALAYHQIGQTSGRIKNFATFQTLKNQPLLLYKNVPRSFMLSMVSRFLVAYLMFFGRAITRKQIWTAIKGTSMAIFLIVKKTPERWQIQKNRKVSDDYIWNIITHDLPPNAFALKKLRYRLKIFKLKKSIS